MSSESFADEMRRFIHLFCTCFISFGGIRNAESQVFPDEGKRKEDVDMAYKIRLQGVQFQLKPGFMSTITLEMNRKERRYRSEP